MKRPLKAASFLLALAGLNEMAMAADSDAFSELAKQVSSQLKGADERQIMDFIAQAESAGRPFEASMVLREYFAQNFNPPAAVLLAAARLAVAAGQPAQAAAHLKRYLKDAQPSTESGLAVSELYDILIIGLGRDDDAYSHMIASELRFSGAHPRAGRHDMWFLSQAQKRGDLEALALGLRRVFASKPAAATLHQYAWPALRSALSQARFAPAKEHAQVAAFAALIDVSGMGPADQARARYAVALFEYRRLVEAEPAKADGQLGNLLAAVDAAISAAATEEVFSDLAFSLAADASGTKRDAGAWAKLRERALPTLVKGFAKLPEAERNRFPARRWSEQALRELGTPADFWRAGARDVRLYRHQGAQAYRAEELLALEGDSAKTASELAKVVGGDSGLVACAARSLAAGADLSSVARHFFAQESWRLSAAEASGLWRNGIEQALAWRLGGADAAKRAAVISAADWMAAVGRPWYASLPLLANDQEGVRQYLDRAWKADDDRSRYAADVQALAWIPFSRDCRQRAIRDVSQHIRKYFDDTAGRLRKDGAKMAPADKAKAEKDLASRGKAEAALDALASDKGLLPDAAPNPLVKAYVQTLLAGGDVAAIAEAGKPLAEAVRGFVAQRLPLAREYCTVLLEKVAAADPLTPLQAQVLGDLLGNWQADGDNDVVMAAYDGAIRARRDWPQKAPAEQRQDLLQVNEALAAVIAREFGAGRASRWLWDRFLETRRGRGWHESAAHAEVCKLALDKDLFGALHSGRNELAAVAAMGYVGREFPSLKANYPVESWFDAAVAKEATAKGWIDIGYWDNGGKDKDGTVAKAAAAVLAGYASLPTVVGDPGWRYTPEAWGKIDHKIFVENGARVGDAAAKVEAQSASRSDATALGYAWFAQKPDLKKAELRSEFFQRLSAVMQRMTALPLAVRHPDLSALAAIPADQASTAELETLQKLLVEHPYRGFGAYTGSEELFRVVAGGLAKQQRWADLVRAAPHLWRLAGDLKKPELAASLAKTAGQLAAADDPARREAAAAIAAAGLEVAKTDLDDAVLRELDVIVSKVHVVTGGIPVAQTDPAYAVYLAQQNWRVGRLEGAWDAYRTGSAATQVLGMFEKLDPNFLLFLVEQHGKREQLDEADNLVRSVLLWLDGLSPGVIDAETRARVLLAQADLYALRKDWAVARAKYQYVAEAEEFARLAPQTLALLKMADTDRAQRRFDVAREVLNKLARRSDAQVRAMAKYYLAKVRYDEEAWQDSYDLLAESLELNEDDAEAKLFLNEVRKKLLNIKDATSVDLGTAALRTRLVPGRPLTIQLKDKNKALAKRSATVRLTLWTEAVSADGSTQVRDREELSLAPLGESGDIFEATISTAMDAVQQGDKTLQLLGNEKVYFELSEEFRRDTNYQGASTRSEMRVLSDAELYASSAGIQSRDELAELKLRQELARIANINQAKEQGVATALAESRSTSEIRPGNSFNLRLIDFDRNYTDGVDSVQVDVVTTSGDRIQGLSLAETAPHSGTFEGKVPTAKRPAYAIASDSRVGTDANVVVSPNKSGALTPWIGQDGIDGPRHLTIDLNDLVALGKTSAVGVDGHGLQRVVVQTSLDNQHFTTVGAFPDAFQAWDGSLQVDLVPAAVTTAADHETFSQLFDVRYLAADSGRARLVPKSGAFALDYEADLKAVFDKVSRLAAPGAPAAGDKNKPDKNKPAPSRGGSTVAGVTLRMRAAIWVPQRTVRTFYVMAPAAPANSRGRATAGPKLFIDGAPIVAPTAARGAAPAAGSQQGIPVELTKGLHVIEIIHQVSADAGPQAAVTVKIDTPQPPYTAELGKSDLDLSAAPPAVLAEFRAKPAAITQQGADLSLDFAGRPARSMRLWFIAYTGGAPGLKQVLLADAAGKAVLPIPVDYTELRENQTLELAPGDTVTVSYQDPHTYAEDSAGLHQASLRATYANATVSAAFVRFAASGDGTESFAAIRRFDIGDTVKIFVKDNDLDTSDQPDQITVRISTSEGQGITIPVVETGPHTGTFRGTFFPVAGTPQEGKTDQLSVKPGDDVTITYRDQENTSPGVPWDRSASIEQAVWVEPQFRVYGSQSQPLPSDEIASLVERSASAPAPEDGSAPPEAMVPQYRLVLARPEQSVAPGSGGPALTSVVGGPLPVEITWPTVCKASDSTVTIYAQTQRGRDKHNAGELAPGQAMDLSVPGTIELIAKPGAVMVAGRGALPPIYLESLLLRSATAAAAGAPLDDGTFGFNVPMFLGDCPDQPLLGDAKAEVDAYGLYVTAGDRIHIGFKYQDQKGEEHWFTQTVDLVGDAVFDVMDRKYEQALAGVYVGEQAYLRLVDPMRNTTDAKDKVVVAVKAASGKAIEVELVETLSHSGIFKGLVQFVHEEDKAGLENQSFQNALPVKYGDTVELTYGGAGTPLTRSLTIAKGADGEIQPFTKKFKDPDIAMRTMFTIAEAYFEMAKKHRTLADEHRANNEEKEAVEMEELARAEIRQGRKLLDEAVKDFPDTELRVQADYLTAELFLELAKDTQNAAMQAKSYNDALGAFATIIKDYPDSEYAPKAQFKKAMVYEKMGEMDLACAEYVKLSYKYPGNELIAETIARLGNFFLDRGKAMNKEADGMKDPLLAAQKRQQAQAMYVTAGNVLTKLKSKFPDHQLAAQTTVIAGMCYRFGAKWQDAHDVLTGVIADAGITDPETKAEAYYWLGDAYVAMAETRSGTIRVPPGGAPFDAGVWAYQAFTKLTWEYPETVWARYARGMLTGNAHVKEPQP